MDYRYSGKQGQLLPPKRARERARCALQATCNKWPPEILYSGGIPKDEGSFADMASLLETLLPAGKNPGSFLAAARFIARNIIRVLKRPTNVIQALQQRLLLERVQFEREALP